MKVEVVAHNPNWKEAFREEAENIATVLGENLVTTHHIGSTAVATIYAKPVIDFLIEVKELTEVDKKNHLMQKLGYEVMGECGIANRRYFRKENPPGARTHNVHIFETNDTTNIKRHLAFRNYLIAHPKEAQEYSLLKQELAKKYPNDIYGYMDGKDAFIKEVEKRALAWWCNK